MISTFAPAGPTPAPTDPTRTAADRSPGWRLSHALSAAGLVALLILWSAVWLVVSARRDEAIDAEVRQNANVARALQEQTERVLATVDHATLRVRDAVVAHPDAVPDLERFANETGLAPKILVQLSQVWPDGRFAASNLDPTGERTGHVDLSQREHVRIHLAPHTLPERDRQLPDNGLFVGKPVLGKVSQRWTIQLSRKIVAADGRVLGVVVASLDPAYFEAVYARVQLGGQGGVTLAGSDLNVRARVIGGQAKGMGTSIGSGSRAARPDLPAEGHYLSTSSIDGVDRIYAHRRISGYPMNIFVFTGREEALAAWNKGRLFTVAMASVASLLLVTVLALLALGLRRQERANEALRASEMAAQSANRAKTEFLAAISHELRTPLTSIRGFAELMERRIEHPVFREQAGLIRKGAEHLNTLLTEILDMTRIEAGAMPIVPEPQDLRQLVTGVGEFFEVAAAAKGLRLEVQVAPEVPPQVSCDPLRTKQILNNLMSNAIKFTAQGRVGLQVERQGDTLLLHVTDTGPGIAAEQHELIFEKFRQGNDRVSYQHGGTGLGLALSRSLAELMGGRLSLRSVPGAGSTFTFMLPLRDAGVR
ncbi:ATP-binding protein [Piscinibacter sp.]|uniref:sensor histidine kinase n=1 Tax=Piscinibacter sp. TaxID=1903157 RepID=UPI00258FA75B|nr:ATP-binding protein [Piscinibacter sp.]